MTDPIHARYGPVHGVGIPDVGTNEFHAVTYVGNPPRIPAPFIVKNPDGMPFREQTTGDYRAKESYSPGDEIRFAVHVSVKESDMV
jgi:hypothetical protein